MNTSDKHIEQDIPRRNFLKLGTASIASASVGSMAAVSPASAQSNPSKTAFPHAFNHIGLNVSDLNAAVQWYQDFLGANVLIPAFEIVAGEGEAGQRFAMLAGPTFKSTRVAYLTFGNGVGLEIFQFADPETNPPTEVDDPQLGNYWRSGMWHFSITDPDIDGFIARVEASGGRRISKTVETPPGSGYKLAFVKDPFGILFEVMTVSFEQGLSNLV